MIRRAILVVVGILGFCNVAGADDEEKLVRKAMERSTLNQAGTKPFHLRATVDPTLERDRESNRTGEIEVWWVSPTQWKREVRSPEFRQIEIVNAGQDWQKNEGGYFPEWLRETSIALIDPVPSLDEVLVQLKNAEVRRIAGTIHYSWTEMSSDGKVEKGMGAGLTITEKTGLLYYGSGLDWSGAFKDYKNFHGRMVAMTIEVGTPEVTAKIATLEDLRDVPPGFFDAGAAGGDPVPLRTVVVEETTLRKNLPTGVPVVWPALKDGPLEGIITTRIVVDRAGKVRELGPILSDNPGLSETAGKAIGALQFNPYMQNGATVQVVSRVTMPFKTVRPEGMETFDSAHNYFENGRHVSFPAAGTGQAYILRATFKARVAEGAVEEGEYVDTWKSDTEWRREAKIGKSRFVRSRNGDTRYLQAEGKDKELLQVILRIMEPIPAIDTFIESDWRIKRDSINGLKTVRVLAGYESPTGELDPQQARGYWFDESGKLVKTYFRGIETQRLQFADFGGVQIARQIRVLHDDKLAVLIQVTDVSAAGHATENAFVLRGHEWKRQFTDETR